MVQLFFAEWIHLQVCNLGVCHQIHREYDYIIITIPLSITIIGTDLICMYRPSKYIVGHLIWNSLPFWNLKVHFLSHVRLRTLNLCQCISVHTLTSYFLKSFVMYDITHLSMPKALKCFLILRFSTRYLD